ncbi:aminotransferase class V-fold PLP-dependent enzyme [Gluconobacter aidae]|uniref:Aminotransferase class V-fold PLP-dependent enzyme n=1 Tax=Gluconobacter aidae TaxID=2662454 RepID=A0A7X1SQG6_9PROT|nr:aminotransferase class V-fold PLP-dependent enzyme [Gluconobacter aidae]MQR99287.1 aminotransferase class V-fold PLP-dependent enzyme [Gluconobacter aidae]
MMRDLISVPESLAYYDCAHMGLVPKTAFDAAAAGMAVRGRPWLNSGADALADTLRKQVAQMLGADAAGISIVPSTSYAMAFAARVLSPKEGRILALAGEHPSQILPWKRLNAEAGVRLEQIPAPREGNWTQAVLDCLDDDVSVLCLPQCHWLDGAALDLERIAGAARSVGARLVIDATQSAGARRLDLAAIRPDIVALSGYKWLLGPMGVSYLYVAPALRDALPLEDRLSSMETQPGWLDAPDNVRYPTGWKGAGQRFDAGGVLNPIQLSIACEGVRTVAGIGVDVIENELGRRNRALIAAHPDIPFGNRAEPSHILSVGVDDLPFIRDAMTRTGVAASIRGRILRFSGHLWNDDGDTERLHDLLSIIRSRTC